MRFDGKSTGLFSDEEPKKKRKKKIKITEDQYNRLSESLHVDGVEIFAKDGNLVTGDGQSYEMCVIKSFLCVDLTVEEIKQKGSDYIIKLDTPIGKKESKISLDKLQKIITQIGEDEIEFDTKTSKSEILTIRLKKTKDEIIEEDDDSTDSGSSSGGGSKWETGLTRGKANPIDNTVWSSGASSYKNITRGPANPL
jgi:hypothetical protein